MTDRSVTTRQRRPEARPSEIVAAALDLFAEKGFAATRLDDVASCAGLSKAGIYLYFKDKTSLLMAVVEAAIGGQLDFAQAAAANHSGPVAPLFADLLSLIAGHMNRSRLPDIIKLIVGESRAHPEIGRAYLDNVINRALPLFQDLLQRGIEAGEFRAVDTRLAVKGFIAPMLVGALWKSVFEPIGAEPLDVEALARQHADIFLKGLRP